MFIAKNTVMAIDIEAGEAFDVTGHYPILAGLDSRTGGPLYVAQHNELNSMLTCVKNGASHATFINADGRTETVNEFRVPVLRHDPVNLDSISVPEGAMDPTGPVFWLKYWPKRDPSLPEDPTFTALDQHLESVLT